MSGPSGAVLNALRHCDDLGLRVAVVDSLTKAFGFGLGGIQGEKTRLIGVIFVQHKNRRVPNAHIPIFFNYDFSPIAIRTPFQIQCSETSVERDNEVR